MNEGVHSANFYPRPLITSIRAVLFDLDGTLYDRDEHIQRLARLQFEAFFEDLKGIGWERFMKRNIELDVHGHGRPANIFSIMVAEWGLRSQLADALHNWFRDNFHANLRLSEDARRTLDTLQDRGLRLGIITNGPSEWQSRKVDALGIRGYFASVVISGEEGVQKPDSVIFERAAARCGVTTTEAMFVGDNPDADVRGALMAGMHPVWKRMPYWEAPEGVTAIENLSEIFSLLGEPQ